MTNLKKDKRIQVLYIHGGMTFKRELDYLTYLKNFSPSLDSFDSWSAQYLDQSLPKNFQIIRPRMPLRERAKYRDWAIVFSKYLDLLQNKYILIGNSLGGIFLAKYLSENRLKKQALSCILVAPPFDNELGTEELSGGFNLKKDLSLLEKNSKHLHLFFSQDDPVIPIAQAKKYKNALSPKADIRMYKNKGGHFRIAKFAELIKIIKKDSLEGL